MHSSPDCKSPSASSVGSACASPRNPPSPVTRVQLSGCVTQKGPGLKATATGIKPLLLFGPLLSLLSFLTNQRKGCALFFIYAIGVFLFSTPNEARHQKFRTRLPTVGLPSLFLASLVTPLRSQAPSKRRSSSLSSLMGSHARPRVVNILLSWFIGLGHSRRAGFPVHLKNIGLTAVRRQKA